MKNARYEEIDRLRDENNELLEALTGLLDSFIHDNGGRNKANMAKTAIFKHCPDVGKAASKAQEAIWHTEGKKAQAETVKNTDS